MTVNPQLHVDQHPIPRVDELFAKLQGGQHFSKLDMSDAYLQVELYLYEVLGPGREDLSGQWSVWCSRLLNLP